MLLADKVAIVTGAGQGIGLAICRKLLSEGAKVILNDLDEALVQKAAKEAAGDSGTCLSVAGDASDLTVINQMVETAVSVFGKLDIAIANAGITLFGDFFTYEQKAFNSVLQVNLGGTFFLAQAAAGQMKKQEGGGSLLFMSSVTGHQAHKNLAAYAMTKAAIEMLAKNLVIELSPFRINVNCIAPGATATERTLADKEYEQTWSRITPMGRSATVTDSPEAAGCLGSDKARHITGQALLIDGGWTAVSPSPY